ncbi:hypothetical protein B0T16DRAFT_492009 [Cercophora newfieldiana]|uniref:F-box domain-containing protein n=1 Tax=Cercophora newfieldiana TaxID=92897 RepID=A0AA39YB38_9PEZI|nr:hypothetical protein B0T16DRAFT_492009 [Cercophora newfieldiana]
MDQSAANPSTAGAPPGAVVLRSAPISPVTETMISPITEAIIQKKKTVDFLNKLPTELLIMVCENICHNGVAHRKSLVNLSRVCQRMPPLVRPILFRRITIGKNSRTRLISLLRVLDNNPDLGTLIHEVGMKSEGCLGTFSASDVVFLGKISKELIGLKHSDLTKSGRSVYTWADSSIHAFALLLAMAPNTAKVDLGAHLAGYEHNILSRNNKNARMKPAVLFEGVTSLEFDLSGQSGLFYGISELFTAMPNLEHLVLNGGYGWEFRRLPTFNAPNIVSLTLRKCSFSTTTLKNILGNFKNLRAFHFVGHFIRALPVVSAEFVLSLAAEHKKTLCNLTIADIADRDRISEIEGFTELETLDISQYSMSGFRPAALVELVIGCPNLKHIYIRDVFF